MQTQEAIKNRRSIRTFSEKSLPKETIENLIDCARLAPTARNEQPWQFVVITDAGTLKRIADATDYGRFIAKSPCCIAVFCQDTKYYLEDGAAATENILIAVSDLGLGACWVAGDKKTYLEEVKKLLGAPADVKLVSLIPVGYSEGPLPHPPKRKLEEVLHWEKW